MDLQIGILETGRPPRELGEKYGSYPDMFEQLLAGADANLEFTAFAALDGEIPDDPNLCHAWLITGSRHGVYDALSWMAPLGQLIRDAVDARVPIVGICFGHQIVAEALGGKVEKSERGWGVGVHEYGIAKRPVWMANAPEHFAVHAVHQDQVVDLPEGADVVASSPFCPNAVLAYGDRAFTIQPHPEFGNDFKRDLMDQRLADIVPEEILSTAKRSLGRKPNSDMVAEWIVAFVRHAIAQREGNQAA